MKCAKRIFAALLAAVFAVTMVPLSAFAASGNTPKEEVVYINLNSNGSVREINVVNIFDLASDGKIVDYGRYESLRNMTTNDKISYSGGKVTINAKAGKLYYEGKLSNNVMPWNISIRYYMGGKKYTAEEIAGKSGDLKIKMEITENKKCKGNFFEGYALQVNFTLDTDKCSNIRAQGATVANVGSDKQLTYTVFPDKGADIDITAKVKNFEMNSIAVNGVKLNLAMEIDDAEIQRKIDDIIGAVNDLDDGANELNNGAGKLKDGTGKLKNGTDELYSGIGALNSGIADLAGGLSAIISKNDELLNGAYSAFEGLCSASEALINAELEKNGLSTIKLTPKTYSAVLTNLLKAMDADSVYNTAYNKALAEVKKQVEANEDALYEGYINNNADAIYLSYIQSQADTLYSQVAAQAVFEQLVDNGYTEEQAAEYLRTAEGQAMIGQAVNAMTDEQKQQIIISAAEGLTDEQKTQLRAGALASMTDEQKTQIKNGYIEQTMKSKEVTDQITAAVTAADKAAANIAKIKGQLDNYSLFYEGLKSYISAVSDAAKGANALKLNMDIFYSSVGVLNTSVGELDEGVKSMFDGTSKMKNGTDEFSERTVGMNTEVSDEINEMVSSLSGSDVEVTSFVSAKNTNIEAVQFVIQSDAVKIPEAEDSAPAAEEKLNFWQKLLRLFGLY